jgi:hypothetical protein
VVLFRVGLPGSTARMLSLLLLLEGITLGTSSATHSIFLSYDDVVLQYPWVDAIFGITHTFGDCGMLALYPPFFAAALQTPLTRPFLNRRVRMGLAAFSIFLFIFVVATESDASFWMLYLSLMMLFIFAMVSSVQAWLAAKGVAREKAGIFALAFGFRDICWGAVYGVALVEVWTGASYIDSVTGDVRLMAYVAGTLVAIPLIGYGILRTHLFDIDLKIRWTIKQSTLAGIIVTIVFVLSEGADRLLSSELGSLGGLGAAAIVVFFLAPLQRFAERVASAAMPNTENTPEYAAFRKMQVYEEAVSEAHYEGGISHKERALLVRLRDSLGITESDAAAIEGVIQTKQVEFA